MTFWEDTFDETRLHLLLRRVARLQKFLSGLESRIRMRLILAEWGRINKGRAAR